MGHSFCSYFLDKEIQLSPFNKSAALALKKSIENFAQSKNISLTSFSSKLKSRNLKTVCKTFHKAGLAVPYNRKTDVGYRQLGESDGKQLNYLHGESLDRIKWNFRSLFRISILANLKKILSQITEAKGDRELITAAMDKLQPLITAANIGKPSSVQNSQLFQRCNAHILYNYFQLAMKVILVMRSNLVQISFVSVHVSYIPMPYSCLPPDINWFINRNSLQLLKHI